MEKDTVTIEIKQEVSVTLLWIVGGVIVVSLAFFLTPPAMDMWPSLNAAGIAGTVYLLVMITYALRKPLKTVVRIWVGVAALIVLALGAFTWIRMQQTTEWQAETLLKIRGVISRGIMRSDMSAAALKALDAYYQQRGSKTKSLEDIFRSQHSGVTLGENIHKPEWVNDEERVIVAKLEPGTVELVSQETFVEGRDPQFKNHNGQLGMIQERFIVTEKGITHVSEN